MQVLRIDGDEVLSHCNLESNSSVRSTFTTSDVAWSLHNPWLAASATNGSVVVFNVGEYATDYLHLQRVRDYTLIIICYTVKLITIRLKCDVSSTQ